jgi:hypothetical protein
MVIRRRILHESHSLPIFAPDDPFANICKANARIDRFEIRYPKQKLQYLNPQELVNYVTRLAGSEAFTTLGRNTEQRYNAVKFRNNLLLDGKKIYFNHRPSNGRGTCTFPIVLNANYNRFYQANTLSADDVSDDFRLENGLPINMADCDLADLFNADTPALAEAQTLTLDQQDNLLLRNRWREAGNVLTLLPQQIRLSQQFIESQFQVSPEFPLNDIPEHNGRVPTAYLTRALIAPMFDWRTYSIPYLEVCWDFQCRNAIAIAKQYQHPMRQITTQMRTRYHHYKIETHNNLVSHSAALINGIRLAVYAKTPTRLRFEVVYEKSLNSMFRQQLRGVHDIRGMLDIVLDDATERLTRFIHAMRRHNTPATIDRAEAMADFVRCIYQALQGNDMNLQGFFSRISHSGRIILTQQDHRFFPMFEQLEDDGIMQRMNRQRGLRTRTYSFTEPYDWLLRGMME